MEIINKKGGLISACEWKRQKTPMVSLDGVASVFETNIRRKTSIFY
jgi:hypothetical protein